MHLAIAAFCVYFVCDKTSSVLSLPSVCSSPFKKKKVVVVEEEVAGKPAKKWQCPCRDLCAEVYSRRYEIRNAAADRISSLHFGAGSEYRRNLRVFPAQGHLNM